MLIELLRQASQALAWVVVVAPWEQAIRVRLGRQVTLLQAGTYLRIPFIDRVYKQSVRRRLIAIPPQTLTTLDGRVVTCAGALGFAILDLRKLYDTLEAPNDTLVNQTAGLIGEYIAARKLAECQATELEAHVVAGLKLGAFGLGAEEFRLTSFATSRTYRLITGGIEMWTRDSHLSMAEQR